MTLSELRCGWIAKSEPEVQARIWDRAAESYGKRPLPDIREDPFLKRLMEAYPLDRHCRTLDIGCGAGRYSLAIAPLVAEAVGTDISGEMIRLAEDRSRELGCGNTRFSRLDWSNADIDALGLRQRFQVVFAHMTPAVCDYATLEKMDACSTGLCMLEKPARRTDAVLDQALRLVGIAPEDTDNGMQNIFAYLWCKGYEPQFFYCRETWQTERTTGDMVAWCTDRARLRGMLSPEEERTIRDFVESLAENEIVTERTNTTRVTVIWKKET